MDGYTIEIDQLHNDVVVLVVPALRLVVFGRTMDEALSHARASIAFRGVEAGDPADSLLSAAGEDRRSPSTSKLVRLRQDLLLTDEERQVIDGDLAAYRALRQRTWDVPTPAGPTPRELEQLHASDL